jgi:hypothetical protein
MRLKVLHIDLLRERTVTIMAKSREESHPIVIPMEDNLVHTDHDQFCSDPTCPCHEDPELLADVAWAVEQGLLTPDEATRVAQGKTV